MTQLLSDEELFAQFVEAMRSGQNVDIKKFTSHDHFERLSERLNMVKARLELKHGDHDKIDTLSDISYISPYNKVSSKYNKLKIVLTYFYGKNKYYFHVDPNIFNDGYHKIAYRATLYKSDVSTSFAPRFANNTSVVLKIKKKPSFHTKIPIHTMQRNGWNTDLQELESLKRFTTEWNQNKYSDKEYNVSHASVLKVSNIGQDGTGIFKDKEYVLVEPYMPTFAKWNWPGAAEKDAKALSIQAFGHYTYHSSQGKLLINDAQGYRDSDKYVLTDPYILYSHQHEGTIQSWFTDHHCNKFCKSWWRRPKGVNKKELSSYAYPSQKNTGVRPTGWQ